MLSSGNIGNVSETQKRRDGIKNVEIFRFSKKS